MKKVNGAKALKPRRGQKIQVGDYFTIPLKNGEYGLGRIIDIVEFSGDAACVLFGEKFSSCADISCGEENIVSAAYIVTSLLTRYFPIVYSADYPLISVIKFFPEIERYKQGYLVGMESCQTGVIEMFLNAYFGLSPWDECADPNYYESMLISPDKKPANLIYSKQA